MTFKCHTCEVCGLYGLDKIGPLHLEPIQQLTYEAHDVELRETEPKVTVKKIWQMQPEES